jgi:hypothetical protein
MLYQMVTGKLPFKGHDFLEYKQLHQTAPAPELTTAFPRLNALVARCLAKRPCDRLSDFVELRKALEAAVFDPYETYYSPPHGLPSPAVAGELTGEELLDKATSLLELHRPEQALAALDEQLARSPEDRKAHAQKGILLMNTFHRYKEALISLERAQQLGERELEKRIDFCRHKTI